MNTKQFEYGVGPYRVQSDCYLNTSSIFVSASPHFSHHHEHPAH